MADKLSSAQEQLMALINNKAFAQAAGSCLAEIAVELMDSKAEAAHWKQSFETVRDEIKVLAATVIKQRGAERLVITQAEFAAVPKNTELWLDTPEPGVRIYELRQRVNGVNAAVGHILRPN